MSNPIARRLRPSLARFPKIPEKSFDKKASRKSCVIDKSPPEKSYNLRYVRLNLLYQKNVVNRPSNCRLSLKIQSGLSCELGLKTSHLRNVFDKGANELYIAQSITYVNPLSSPPVCCEDNQT